MRFIVVGAGAVGSLVGARLAGVHDVTLLGRARHMDAIRHDGLRISGDTELHQTALDVATDPRDVAVAPDDVILMTVKAYDTEAAVASLPSSWTTSTFVSLQNGLGNEETIAARASKVLGAVINQGATFLGPGEVRHAGDGEIEIGSFQATGPDDVERVVAGLRLAGLPAQTSTNIRGAIWAKVILNAAVNPLTALLGLRTGELLGNEALAAVLRLVVDESAAIAAACDVPVAAGEILDKIEWVAAATRKNKSSMLQDIERGRRTEIGAINGALVERARARGVPCPVNELLTHMVIAAERADAT